MNARVRRRRSTRSPSRRCSRSSSPCPRRGERARRHRARRQPRQARREGRAGDRGAQRDRGAEDQPLRAGEAQGQAQLLEVDLRVARRGHLAGPGALPLRRQGGLEAQAGPLARRPLQEHRLQPRRRCSTSPNPAPGLRLQRQLDLPVGNQALDLLDEAGGQVARTSLAWCGCRALSPASYNWYGSDLLYEKLLARGMQAAVGAHRRALLGAAQPRRRARTATDQLRPAPQHYDEMAELRGRGREALPGVGRDRGLERAQLPALLGRLAGARRVREDAEEVADALHSAGARDDGRQRRALAARRLRQATRSASATSSRSSTSSAPPRRPTRSASTPTPGVGPGEDYIADVRVYLGKMQNVMRASHGDADRPMWATEFGVSTTGDARVRPRPSGQRPGRALRAPAPRARASISRSSTASSRTRASAAARAASASLSQNLAPKPAYCDAGAGPRRRARAGC